MGDLAELVDVTMTMIEEDSKVRPILQKKAKRVHTRRKRKADKENSKETSEENGTEDQPEGQQESGSTVEPEKEKTSEPKEQSEQSEPTTTTTKTSALDDIDEVARGLYCLFSELYLFFYL